MMQKKSDILVIEFERSGGFTGIPVRVILDEKLLTADERSEITQLIESSGFMSLKSDKEQEHALHDQFQYRITVETTKYSHTILLSEHEITDPIRPLIRFLSARTRRGRGKRKYRKRS